jgi:hypothetical protein
MTQPSLRPQDVVVLLKLFSYRGRRPSMAQMGIDLSLSSSEVHAALKRLVTARLVSGDGNRPLRAPAEEFLLHGLKYVFPPKRGEVTRGVPTSYAAPPLDQRIAPGTDLPPVWPLADGRQRGIALEPLYRSAPAAALCDQALYELLALIDAVRDGRARERKLAEHELTQRLREYARPEPDAARSRG